MGKDPEYGSVILTHVQNFAYDVATNKLNRI